MLVTEGRGPIEYFSIRLTECTLIEQKGQEADNPRFIATFEGPSNENGNFTLSGEARGASLAIADRYGRQAIPGQPLPPVGIDSKSMALLYQARIVKNNEIPKAGITVQRRDLSWNTIKWIGLDNLWRDHSKPLV